MPNLESTLHDMLKENTAGINECDLIKQLQQQKFLPEGDFFDSSFLFRVHFLLFHALYRLRDKLVISQSGLIEIELVKIYLKPYMPGTEAIQRYDPLREYYLDLSQLENTSADEIEQMLGQFWSKYYAYDERQEALAVLSLAEPVEYSEVKLQYKRLAMLHHPDRGGDGQQLQAINQAMDVLKRYYVGASKT
jgi:hypothetical protein